MTTHLLHPDRIAALRGLYVFRAADYSDPLDAIASGGEYQLEGTLDDIETIGRVMDAVAVMRSTEAALGMEGALEPFFASHGVFCCNQGGHHPFDWESLEKHSYLWGQMP